MKMKQFLCILLTLCMVLGMVPMTALAAEIDNGSCGDNANWSLTDDGTLTISGTGATEDWPYSGADIYMPPWLEYRSQITKVVVAEGITYLGDYAFADCPNLKQITYPATLTALGDGVYYNCDSITAAVIPDSVTTVGKSLFEDCASLAQVTFSKNMTVLSEEMFARCISLTAMVIPDNITAIGIRTFSDCWNMQTISIPDSVTVIDVGAFEDCDALTEVVVPNSVTVIRTDAFYSCDKLANVVLPDSLREMESAVFSACLSLKNLTIPVNVSLLGSTFEGANALETVKFLGHAPAFAAQTFNGITVTAYYPSNFQSWTQDVLQDYGGNVTWVGYISELEPGDIRASGTCGENVTWTITSDGVLTIAGSGAMENYITQMPWTPYASMITEVRVQNGVTTIGNAAFYELNQLKAAYISGTVTQIGSNSFFRCYALERIDIPTGVVIVAQSAFQECTGLTTVVMADTVTTLGDYAFSECSSLADVTFSQCLETIGQEAFMGTALGDVELPASLTEIDKSAFYGSTITGVVIPANASIGASAFSDTPLAWVEISEGVTTIGSSAFANTKLTTVTIPASMESLNASAFNNCTSLKEIYFQGLTPPTIGNNAFGNVTATVYYPGVWSDDVKQDYGGTLTWVVRDEDVIGGTFGENMRWRLYDGVLTISGQGAMEDFPGSISVNDSPWAQYQYDIQSVIIENGVTSVGAYAFTLCSNLTSVTLPGSITAIGDGAFYETGLVKLELPANLKTIGTDAFQLCGNLEQVSLPNGLTTIGVRAFAACWSLTEVQIPNTVTTLGERAFYDCPGLKKIQLPAGLTAIESELLTNSANLTEIVIPAGVTSIGWGAFMDSGVKTVTFRCNAPSIAENAFTNVKANMYYPANDATWTVDKKANYGGSLTWIESDAMDAPAILSCYSKLQDSVKVTWTVVANVDGYELWRTTDPVNGEWTRVKTINSGDTDRYTNQGLTEGVTYYYKVRAFVTDASGERTYSEFSNVDYMPAAVVFDGPYSNATFRIRLRWNEVGGAHGYQIWRQNEDGSWNIVKTLGDKGNTLTNNQGGTTAYSNTDLTAGDTYVYKMRAFMITEDGRKVFGAYSDEYAVAVMPEVPAVTVTSPKAGRAQISWEPVNGAVGYQIWMEQPDGSFTIIKSITDGSTSYTKTGLETNFYFFKVRAYAEVQGRKTFSEFTPVYIVDVL